MEIITAEERRGKVERRMNRRASFLKGSPCLEGREIAGVRQRRTARRPTSNMPFSNASIPVKT
jgi:hypothetical protein